MRTCSTSTLPTFGSFVLKTDKRKHGIPVHWDNDGGASSGVEETDHVRHRMAAGAVPLFEFNMRHMWNKAMSEAPMVDPSGDDKIDMWVHNYGDVVLISVEDIHAEYLADFWSDYGLDVSLGDVADCDWGYLTSLDDQRQEE